MAKHIYFCRKLRADGVPCRSAFDNRGRYMLHIKRTCRWRKKNGAFVVPVMSDDGLSTKIVQAAGKASKKT